MRRNSVEMAVTNKRVTVKIGLMSRNTQEMMLQRIESIMVHQTVMGRMLNYGTITLRGVGGTPDPFPTIAHPLEFRRQVQQQLDALQGPTPLQTPPRLCSSPQSRHFPRFRDAIVSLHRCRPRAYKLPSREHRPPHAIAIG